MQNEPNQSEMAERQDQPNGTKPTTNLPVVVTDEEGGLLARWTTVNPTFASNMNTSTPSGRALLTRCLAKCAVKTRNAVGKTLEVVGYVAHEAEILNKETGEYERKLRAVLVCENGDLISTMSGPVLTTLKTLMQCRGRTRWDPPSLLEIREHPTEGGKSYCDMIEHDPVETESKAKKK